MKRLASLACLYLMTLSPGNAAEPVNPQEQQLATIVKELQEQQDQIVRNQAKIDAKLVTIAEAVRIARIYSSRGGN